MNLSDFQREQIQIFLDSFNNPKESNLSGSDKNDLTFFEKSQVFKFLDKDTNPPKEKKVVVKRVEQEPKTIIKKEIIKQEITDDVVNNIITSVKSEIQVSDGIDGRDGKDAPTLEEIIDALKRDSEFIQKIRPHTPKYFGGGGLGEKDVNNIVDEKVENGFIDNTDRILTAEIDINNIVDNGKYVGDRVQLVVVDNDGNVVTEGGF